MTINEKISAIRVKMLEFGFDAYLIPSSDPHQSEYVAAHWQSRVWASGFTGSAGILIITKDHAGIWTDSRYFLQAEEQLKSSDVVLHKQKIPHAPEHIQWLADSLNDKSTIAFDGMLFSKAQVRNLAKSLQTKDFVFDYSKDLIDMVWRDRPALPLNMVFEHGINFSGISRKDKLIEIRKRMNSASSSYHLVAALDSIAWVLNVRSNDVDCNPVTISYLLIGQDRVVWFIDAAKLTDELKTKLRQDEILIKPYEDIFNYLSDLKGEKILLNPSTCNIKLFNTIPEDSIVTGTSIPNYLKSIKNDTEVKNIRSVMVKDGVALLKLYRWLESTIEERAVPETEVARQLIDFRRAGGDYHGESFDAIVGYNGNGAIVHYRAEEETCAEIKPEGILLLDSGGQYLDGTTDITRTTALGTPTGEQIKNYTLVLKGHIGLATVRFPEGTKGLHLDILARQHLWQHGLNYGHGTGHGVGYFLNVHEGPQGISGTIAGKSKTVFEPGMFTSNEPGFYKNGEYGIRIENLILAVKDEETDYGQFLRFETLTLFPIDLKLVDKNLLTAEETDWLNQYHERVYKKLLPHLNDEEAIWLKNKCKPI